MAYYLRKDKKKRGTYLQMYDRYWDKEKKQARSKSIQAFGYLEDLISDEMPDPLAYYEAYVHRKNEERAASIAEETRPRAFTFPVDYNLGHFLLHSLLEELGVREIIDILASQMRFQFSVYDMIAQLIFARVIYPCSKSKTVSAVFPHLYGSSPIRKIRFTMALLSLAKLTKNISSSLTIAMSGIIRGISARAFLTARIITLRSICLVKTNRKGRPRRINTDPSSARLSFLTRIWSLWPCR